MIRSADGNRENERISSKRTSSDDAEVQQSERQNPRDLDARHAALDRRATAIDSSHELAARPVQLDFSAEDINPVSRLASSHVTTIRSPRELAYPNDLIVLRLIRR